MCTYGYIQIPVEIQRRRNPQVSPSSTYSTPFLVWLSFGLFFRSPAAYLRSCNVLAPPTGWARVNPQCCALLAQRLVVTGPK